MTTYDVLVGVFVANNVLLYGIFLSMRTTQDALIIGKSPSIAVFLNEMNTWKSNVITRAVIKAYLMFMRVVLVVDFIKN